VTHVTAFPPLVGRRPRVLLLGSLPGVASLDANQYYAHPRNLFWTFMQSFTGCAATAPYAQRVAAAKRAGFAVWDVLAAAVRPGSLDAAIDVSTAVPNDFAAFLSRYRTIELIALNGTAAATLFARRVAPTLPATARSLPTVALPSTSPANASLSVARKLARWRSALESRR
jgi:hypoxanthine-DNA glycosylase